MSADLNDDETIAKEVEEGLEEDEVENPTEGQGDTHKKPSKKKAGKKALSASKPAKATAVKPGSGITKKAKETKEPRAPKPRRPFARISDEDLLHRQGILKERMDVAQAQITIMNSKWQKYEDERVIRSEAKTETTE